MGVGGPDSSPRNLVSGALGIHARVKYCQSPLIKQGLDLYCMMDKAENINLWHSLAWK